MKISVIIPAYNEERLLGPCLESVKEAFGGPAGRGLGHEVIVCDNNSSDSTARIAAGAGARVVFEPVNQIGRARNAGAAAAAGEWLLFIDADSRLSGSTLEQLKAGITGGRCCAGGALVGMEDAPPLLGRAAVGLWNLVSRTFRLAAGSFIFCRADAFRETGGFSLELYAAEELDLSRRLARWGRERGLSFIILRGPHVSSGRKFSLYPKIEFLRLLIALILRPRRTLRDPRRLKYLYDGRR
ncbi:MAG: glycosyl transferase family 2 [Elusimicrobia bacterium]|nr:MAG: glycosyl transferase family 2 [Elusimicrobiota bacterium]KAF0154712.1 MAG: glycosyl transferase family 2 [Elusimicrobiota bacterium]